MERTLKEKASLKESQKLAEGLEGNQDPAIAAQVAVAWGLIAVHEVLDRMVNVLNDGFCSLEEESKNGRRSL